MSTLPPFAGLGLKAPHYQAIIETQPAIGWFEIHPENFMGAGGPPHQYLHQIAQDYPLSMHGVGMSLGSADGLDREHLKRLKQLIDRYQPAAVSEHIAWSSVDNAFLNDLLPLPYSQESLHILMRNIHTMQEYLGRKILIENPSVYIEFKHHDMSEPELLNKLCALTGCGILLDINNIVVCNKNIGTDTNAYLEAINFAYVEEIHLAGHRTLTLKNGTRFCVDDHGSRVCSAVWQHYSDALTLAKRPIATLIEWDTDIPPLDTLLDEAQKADKILRDIKAQHTPHTQANGHRPQ